MVDLEPLELDWTSGWTWTGAVVGFSRPSLSFFCRRNLLVAVVVVVVSAEGSWK